MNDFSIKANSPSSLLRSSAERRYDRSENSNGDPIHLQGIRGMKDGKVQLQKVAEEMESLFVKMMYKSMKDTVPKNEFLNGGQAEEIFDDMLTEEYSREFARTKTFGLAKTIADQYSKYI